MLDGLPGLVFEGKNILNVNLADITFISVLALKLPEGFIEIPR